MKKKYAKVFIFLVLYGSGLGTMMFAQSTGLSHSGYFDLELEKNFWTVKHLLEQKLTGNSEQSIYRVKQTERKYHEMMGVPINFIEVRFNKDKKIVDILIVFDKNRKNIAVLKEAISREFGNYPCTHTKGDEQLFRCTINGSESLHKFQFYTFDETGEFPVDGFLSIRFFTEGRLANADF